LCTQKGFDGLVCQSEFVRTCWDTDWAPDLLRPERRLVYVVAGFREHIYLNGSHNADTHPPDEASRLRSTATRWVMGSSKYFGNCPPPTHTLKLEVQVSFVAGVIKRSSIAPDVSIASPLSIANAPGSPWRCFPSSQTRGQIIREQTVPGLAWI